MAPVGKDNIVLLTIDLRRGRRTIYVLLDRCEVEKLKEKEKDNWYKLNRPG